MSDIQKLHVGAKYWPLLSRQKWISSRDQKNQEEVGRQRDKGTSIGRRGLEAVCLHSTSAQLKLTFSRMFQVLGNIYLTLLAQV